MRISGNNSAGVLLRFPEKDRGLNDKVSGRAIVGASPLTKRQTQTSFSSTTTTRYKLNKDLMKIYIYIVDVLIRNDLLAVPVAAL